MSESGLIDLYYGAESGVALEPNVPYGWQFTDETVSMPSERGRGVNCCGLFTRRNESWVATGEAAITARFVVEQVERLSLAIARHLLIHAFLMLRDEIDYAEFKLRGAEMRSDARTIHRPTMPDHLIERPASA